MGAYLLDLMILVSLECDSGFSIALDFLKRFSKIPRLEHSFIGFKNIYIRLWCCLTESLTCPWSCRPAVPSDYESQRIKNARSVFAHTLIHN